MKKNKYIISKKNKEQYMQIDFTKINGLLIKPKNKIEYDGIIVNKLVLINNKFIEMVLKKKIKKKLNQYLNYIIEFIENDTDDDNTRIALGDIERYKNTVNERYSLYLDKKYINLLMKKIDLIETELIKKYKAKQKKKPIIEKVKEIAEVKEEKIGKSR